jgi:hypothetical protein
VGGYNSFILGTIGVGDLVRREALVLWIGGRVIKKAYTVLSRAVVARV